MIVGMVHFKRSLFCLLNFHIVIKLKVLFFSAGRPENLTSDQSTKRIVLIKLHTTSAICQFHCLLFLTQKVLIVLCLYYLKNVRVVMYLLRYWTSSQTEAKSRLYSVPLECSSVSWIYAVSFSFFVRGLLLLPLD